MGRPDAGGDPVCQRCGVPCRPTGAGSPEARVLRRALAGVCASCAATAFLKSFDVLRGKPASVLLEPVVQEQFGRVLASGSSDADPAEIDWPRLVENWSLP